DAMLKSEETKKYPDLILRGGVQRNEAINDNVSVVGLAMALPIFDRNQGNILAARVRVDQARDEQLATDIRLRRDIAQAHERLSAAILEVNYMRDDILPGAQSAVDATTKGFERGKFDFLDVLDAQRTLFAARGQYIRALGEVQRAVAEVESILGPQGGSLFNATQPQN
ncbi:MAG: TolC family protein, partial [Methylobacillus glycogenes]|nr:TolC family protein [Methylobacillus glycogenes]